MAEMRANSALNTCWTYENLKLRNSLKMAP